MRLESIRVKNFKSLQDIYMDEVPQFCVLVGENGTGKSTFFDIFGFLRDCLHSNVTKALQVRGGFKEVISRGNSDGKIEIELKFRMDIAEKNRLVSYILEIGNNSNNSNKAIVHREILRYKRSSYGSPYHFLDFKNGEGFAITNEEDFSKKDEQLEREEQKLDSSDVLAIKGLGQFQKFKAANAFRQLLERWYVSDFHIDSARGSKEITGFDSHLSETGDNLQLVASHLYENHPQVFEKIIEQMQARVPGIGNIKPQKTADGRLLLQFQDGAFKDPFIDKYVSDGTLKMFAYLLLLYNPENHELLCVEEPENQLYPKLLWELAEEFEGYTNSGGQVFVSSHSPDFLNAVGVDNVFWLKKQNGYTTINRANENKQIVAYMREGDQMGYLWGQGFFDDENL
jgi:predicted ATPase